METKSDVLYIDAFPDLSNNDIAFVFIVVKVDFVAVLA